MKRSLLWISLLVTVVITGAASAQQITPFDQGSELDGMCPNGICGSSGTGTAPGTTSCTSSQGCKKCGVSDTTNKLECYTALMENGECTCTSTATASSSSCTLEGTCTYRP